MPCIAEVDHGPVRTIALERPEVRNALSVELREELATALDRAEADEGVRAVVLTGTGGAFCAGLDLRELAAVADATVEAGRHDAARLGGLFLRIHDFPKPVVAAVLGPAVAGGAGLATVCDIVIAGEGARFGYTEARIGFVAALVAVFLVRQVGDRQARELLLTARLIDASTALEIGLVNEVVPDDQVLARARAVAIQIGRNAPGAIAATKKLLSSLPGLELREALREAADANARVRASEELREGVAAFLGKREPAWRPPDLDPGGVDT